MTIATTSRDVTPARREASALADPTNNGGTEVADPWRSTGMRDFDPEAMRRFRRVELAGGAQGLRQIISRDMEIGP